MESLVDNDINFIERFLNAFKTLGGNEFGFIDYEQFKQILQHKNVAETKEITDLVNAERHVSDGKLNFVSLCFSILSTKVIFNRSFANGKVAVGRPHLNTHTFTRNKVSAHPHENTLHADSSSEKTFNKCSRGLLYNINGNMLSNRYHLEVLENSAVEIFAKPLSNKGENTSNIPIEVLVFQGGKNKVIVTFSSIINNDGYCAVNFNLKKGKYILVPILYKWNAIGKSNSFDSLNLESLIHMEEGSNITITPACIDALKVIFNCIDLDENGLVSQSEFDVFIHHASGETSAEEWKTIEDNFDVKDHQLTLDGFLELYKMVLQTDPADVMNMLQQMGMNESLEMENAQPFRLFVKSEVSKYNLSPLPVSSYKEAADLVFRKVAIEQGSCSKVQNMNDVLLFTHCLPHRITLVIQNLSHAQITVRLDCTASTNCESHRGSLDISIEIGPKTSIVGHHFFPIDPTENWDVKCSESLI